MSYSYSDFGSLLSNAGMQSLQAYQNNKSYMNGLISISTKNTYTNEYCHFDTQSIFNCGSQGGSSYTGLSSGSYPSTSWSGWTLGSDGFNRRGPVDPQTARRSSIPQVNNPYSGGTYGASVVGNYFTAIQSPELGEYPPTSVFEQRLNYHLTFQEQLERAGLTAGKSSGSNMFMNAASANSVSELMGKLPSTKSAQGNSALSASGAKNVSEMMSMFKYC